MTAFALRTSMQITQSTRTVIFGNASKSTCQQNFSVPFPVHGEREHGPRIDFFLNTMIDETAIEKGYMVHFGAF